LQPAVGGIALDHLFQTGLMDREAAVVEDLDLALVPIRTEPVLAHFRQASASDQVQSNRWQKAALARAAQRMLEVRSLDVTSFGGE